MAMRALVSKLRIPAAASRAGLFRRFAPSPPPQDKLGSTTVRGTAKEGSPLSDDNRVIVEWIIACDKADKNYHRKLGWYMSSHWQLPRVQHFSISIPLDLS